MTDSTDTSAQQPPPIALEALSGDPTLVDNPSDNPNSNPSERTTRIVDEKATEEQAPIYVPAAEQQNDQDQFETTKNNCYCHHQDKGPEEENVASSTVPAADREDLLDLAKNPNIICFTCKSEFHKGCVSLFSTWSEPPLFGDSFYWYCCKRCKAATASPLLTDDKQMEDPKESADMISGTLDTHKDELKRLNLNWIDVVTIALLNLTYTNPVFTLDDEDNKFYHKNEICDFIEENWERFWKRPSNVSWRGSVSACLNASTNRFRSLSEGLFALDTLEPAQKQCEQRLLLGQKRVAVCQIAEDGSLIEIVGEAASTSLEMKSRKRRAGDNGTTTAPLDGGEIDVFDNLPDVDFKKKKKSMKFADENLDPATAIMIYPDLDNPNNEHVLMSSQPTHTAPQVSVFSDGLTVSNEKGYRMAKATHGVWEGHWYFEVVLNQSVGHTRIGWSQISGDLQAPCGYDIFSYSYRDSPGTLFHNSRPMKDVSDSYFSGYKSGDVLGVSIFIPKIKRKAKDCPIDEELLRRLWDPDRMDQYLPFKSKPLTPVPKSYIEYFKNGQSLGVAFKDLNLGKYHPAISAYGGASVSVNFGPDFIFKPQDQSQPFCKVRNLKTWEESILEHTLSKMTEEERAAYHAEEERLQAIATSSAIAAAVAAAAAKSAGKQEVTVSRQANHSSKSNADLSTSTASKPPSGVSGGQSRGHSNGRSIYTDEDKEKMVKFALASSQAEASRKFNVHKSMISRWILKGSGSGGAQSRKEKDD